MTFSRTILCGLIIAQGSIVCKAQHLSNPSFEGPPQISVPAPGWKACNLYSTPDTQPGFWGVTLPASHGNTYTTLFTRGIGGFINDGYAEAIGTQTLLPFKQNICYAMSVDVAFSPGAIFFGSFGDVVQYDNPVTLDVWLGNAECGKESLVYRSLPVTSDTWQTLDFTFTPDKSYSHFILEAGYVGNMVYFGNILIDNLRFASTSIDLGPDKFLCAGTSIELKVESPDFSEVLWNTGSSERTITVTESGKYAVEVKSGRCIARDTMAVKRLESFELRLPADTTLCLSDELELNVRTDNGSYKWNDGGTSPGKSLSSPGYYSVEVTNGCETRSAGVNLSFDLAGCCNLSAPNVFTPNNDNINDLFELTSFSAVGRFRIIVFNRWGKEVYTGTNLTSFWNGQSSEGRECPPGVYYWRAFLECPFKGTIYENDFRGVVSLLR